MLKGLSDLRSELISSSRVRLPYYLSSADGNRDAAEPASPQETDAESPVFISALHSLLGAETGNVLLTATPWLKSRF